MVRDRETPGRSSTSGRRKPPRSSASDGLLLGLDILFAVLLGAAHALPTAYPVVWWLQLLCVAGFAWQVSRASPGRAALVAWVFSTAWGVSGTWWLYVSMHQYGGLPAWMSGAAVLALNAFLGLYLAITMAVFARLRRHRALLDALLFAACWMLAELARGVIFTGFPWAASGYAHIDSPLANLAPWIGVYGVGFVCAALGAGLVLGMHVIGRRSAGAMLGLGVSATVLIALALIKPVPFTRPSGTLTLTLLQSNVPQDQKFAEATLPQTLDWAQRQLLAAKGQLVIGPETVVPLLPEQLPANYWKPLALHFQGEQAALIGRPLGSFEAGYTNSVVGVSRDTVKWPGGYYRYDKHHLVPFGEFIPTGFRWFTEMMNIPLGDFSRGLRVPPSFAFKGERIAPNICYEDLFGEELAARFIEMNEAPTIFANISNIAWFGDTIAVNQHQIISRMRSLEFQRPMVRATNTGATVVIDHHGVVTHSLPPFTQGVLDAQVEGRQGLTPYAWWASRYGLWPLVAVALVLMLMTLPLRRKE
ncbi:apolipoprotein N-acyltransferase [Rhizobacter sp. J219]|jgi:apolipoprotein N-acyltransferase|uniref:apolipoprotein N-acyltransferase n=1 Tax=Rhizobacter sp. J219 TaxID=2898430 RepID=UPI002150D1C6|nr:apolipoprotein N-acyltransferase [Rhizobacter sp. J219]MCR5885266.1 apolipoprotein N-acyltransferase [Rhizobacter sp. J219]